MKKIFCIIILLALSACGPMYETRKNYIPPQTEAGRFCANQCLTELNNCYFRCEQDKANCQTVEDIKRYTETIIKQNSKNSDNFNDFPISPRSCSDYDCKMRCEQNRDYCHTNCGGQIQSFRVCTAFCN